MASPSMAELAYSIVLATHAIPPGKVSTYGDLGRIVGCGPRLVARVLARSDGEACWWRVIRADGTIAPQLVTECSRLLTAEGVGVRAGRVDLKLYRAALD